MSLVSRSSRKIRSDRFSYRDEPYRRDSHRNFSQSDNTCNNCKRPGHFARECPTNILICHNCGLPGHIVSECSTKSICWNCREAGHTSKTCTNEGICHSCGNSGHQAKDCNTRHLPPGDLRLCNNCYKQGHFAPDCTNEKACNHCRKTGHFARDCRDDPVCNLCNVVGHLLVNCPKGVVVVGRDRRPSLRGIRERYVERMICRNCGGRGHIAYECTSERNLYSVRY